MTEAKAIRVGVIGFGNAGRNFHSSVVDAVPGLELATIVQRSGDAAAQAFPNVKISRSVEEMLRDETIRLVVVATPNNSHFSLAAQALEADRDVVIDKPFALSTVDAAKLIEIARRKKRLISAYQNRRWDGDFLTVKKLLDDGKLGRLVSFESHMDRWRPRPNLDVWRDKDLVAGGALYDLGAHLVDQALVLFGAPEAIFADIRIDRDEAILNDAFDLRLYYPRLTVLLRTTCLACSPAQRFVIHGTQGSYMKWGLDTQEDALKRGEKFSQPYWGEEPEVNWGELTADDHGNFVRTPVQTLPGDYRGYYANVRDALLGTAPLTVTANQAWRTIRVLELARESSAKRAAVPCDFSDKPME
jgi:predicted dehydrogenase